MNLVKTTQTIYKDKMTNVGSFMIYIRRSNRKKIYLSEFPQPIFSIKAI